MATKNTEKTINGKLFMRCHISPKKVKCLGYNKSVLLAAERVTSEFVFDQRKNT